MSLSCHVTMTNSAIGDDLAVFVFMCLCLSLSITDYHADGGWDGRRRLKIQLRFFPSGPPTCLDLHLCFFVFRSRFVIVIVIVRVIVIVFVFLPWPRFWRQGTRTSGTRETEDAITAASLVDSCNTLPVSRYLFSSWRFAKLLKQDVGFSQLTAVKG